MQLEQLLGIQLKIAQPKIYRKYLWNFNLEIVSLELRFHRWFRFLLPMRVCLGVSIFENALHFTCWKFYLKKKKNLEKLKQKSYLLELNL